ncbi:MAG TPA: M56 family metallopeptidase [Longimicrobium sp.]|nr:M56 family metallopeptidase [Longimicrobium sp.]
MSAALLPALFAALLDAALKGTVILLAALLATRQMRRRSAAARHLVWMVALASMLVLPGASRLLPAWRVVPVPAPLRPAASFVAAPPAAPAAGQRTDATAAPSGDATGSGAPLSAAPSEASSPSRASASPEPTEGAFDWKTALLLMWAAGGAALALRLGYGVARVWWMQRRAVEIDDEEWVRITDRLARRLRVGRLVTLLRERHAVVPMTWGIMRPVVLLPSDAEAWDTERRTVVLAHELAHVRRWDTLTQWIAHLALALFWFHPLVWVAARRMREEREHACDDAVLSIGTRPVAYADHLLSIVRSLGEAEGPAAALAMARRSQFEGRLLAILDGATQRGGVTRGLGFAALVVAAAAVLPLAALGAARTDVRPGATHASLTPPAQAPSLASSLRGEKPADQKPEAAKGVLGRIAGQLGALVDRAGDALPGGERPVATGRDTSVKIPAAPPAALPAAPASAASAASGGAGASPARPAPTVEARVSSAGPRLSDAGEALIGRLQQQGGDYADVIRAASAIAGNPERAAVLTAVLRRPDVGPDDLALALRVAGAMTSHPEKRDVLKLAAERYSLAPAAVRTAFFAALAGFTSDPERRDVLQAVVARQGASAEVAQAVILSARAMPGEAERRDVLMAVLERADASPATLLRVVDATNEMPGAAVRRDVLVALLARRGLPGEVLSAVMNAVAMIPSSPDQRDVLIRAAATQRIDGAVREAYVHAAGVIASSAERADALSALLGGGAAERPAGSAKPAPSRPRTGANGSQPWSSDISLSLGDGRVIHVTARRVILGRAGDQIEAIHPGGTLVASEALSGHVRRVEMLPCRECAGGISRRYTVDGRTQPYDAAAQRWLVSVLHTFLPD